MTKHDRVDSRFLAWLGVWSLAMIGTMGGLLGGKPPESLTEEGRLVLGFAIGGLAASWVATGTWLALINLPDVKDRNRQRLRPRLIVALILFLNAACLAWVQRQSPELFGQIVVMVAIGVAGPLIVWHWTHRRIHHGDPPQVNRRSIRQLFGVTFTVALAIAAMNLSSRWTNMPTSLGILIVTNALMWTLMSMAMLSSRWGAAAITLPLLIAQWFIVGGSVDLRERNAEGLLRQHFGSVVGFYLLALLFLMLMRSSGHRWLGSTHRRGSRAGTVSDSLY